MYDLQFIKIFFDKTNLSVDFAEIADFLDANGDRLVAVLPRQIVWHLDWQLA